jgi:N,N'-diacetyllegionaminate synthase
VSGLPQGYYFKASPFMVNIMNKTLIIAEAGVNHNGNIDTAYRLADVAQEAGADCVKFQTFFNVPKYNHLRLTKDEWVSLKEYCDNTGIEFMSTPESIPEIDFLAELGMKRWKVGSEQAKNGNYLHYLSNPRYADGKVILSTGMCSMDEVGAALVWLGGIELENLEVTKFVTVLHCVSAYPAPILEVNLRAMQNVGQRFCVSYGLSDHTLSVEAIPSAAVALGASVIEKHFTLDRNMEGPDHHMSLEPDELKRMVRAIRDVEQALGDGVKRVMPCEKGEK